MYTSIKDSGMISLLEKLVSESGVLDLANSKDKDTCKNLTARILDAAREVDPELSDDETQLFLPYERMLENLKDAEESTWAAIIFNILDAMLSDEQAFEKFTAEMHQQNPDIPKEALRAGWQVMAVGVKKVIQHPKIEGLRSFFDTSIRPYAIPYMKRWIEGL